jgi:CheY-like chemotaxis protein
MCGIAMDNFTILLIEDNPDDVFLMRRALKKAGLDLPLQVATDGNEALAYLSGSGAFEDRQQFPVPSIVFLDLKLPYLDGFEVLEWIRQDTFFKDLDVVILTSSPEQRDKDRARKLGTKGYIVKPPTPAALLEVLGTVNNDKPSLAATC